jgi:Leucine-rich repeat (LRR) protein
MSDTSPPARRWYHPTPEWLILALLELDGLFWLSERFHWFLFNRHKGWTVLIAVAAVGATMLLMLLSFAVSLLCRWRFQFRIFSLIVLTVAVAIPFSWLATEMQQAEQQRKAIVALEKAGGNVAVVETEIGWSQLSAPAWLRSLLGDEFFGDVYAVNLGNGQVTDASQGNLMDAALANLKRLNQLEELNLRGTQVSDRGIENLRELTQLQYLWLTQTNVTDGGLRHLKGLSKLRVLNLKRTKVTDEGIKKIQQALPNCKIER